METLRLRDFVPSGGQIRPQRGKARTLTGGSGCYTLNFPILPSSGPLVSDQTQHRKTVPIPCPRCSSTEVRRSRRVSVREYAAGVFFFYPYRCRRGMHRFFPRWSEFSICVMPHVRGAAISTWTGFPSSVCRCGTSRAFSRCFIVTLTAATAAAGDFSIRAAWRRKTPPHPPRRRPPRKRPPAAPEPLLAPKMSRKSP